MAVDIQDGLERPDLPVTTAPQRATGTRLDVLNRIPWWAVIVAGMGLIMLIGLLSGQNYINAFNFVKDGILLTIEVSLSAYLIAMLIGLIAGLGRVSTNVVTYTLATIYVEIVRGIPLLVQIIVITFVFVPLAVDNLINPIGLQLGLLHESMSPQNIDMVYRATAALAIGYGAYLAEIFRAGIQSISRGQMEAARSLGMNYTRAMRYVILPQAIRVVLPPLGNDFIAMLKDSSLISAVAIQELTGKGRLYISSTFDTFTGWYVVAFTYLVMTLGLSALVRFLERRSATPR